MSVCVCAYTHMCGCVEMETTINSWQFSAGGFLCAGRHLTRSSEIAGFHNCGHATGIEWVEASDAAASPVIPVLKSYPASNTSSALVEKT